MTIISEPGKQKTMSLEKGIAMPETESLQDCANRVKVVWTNGIFPRILHGETVLVVAHANTIRALIRHVDAEAMSVEGVRGVHIPSAVPLVYDFVREEGKPHRPAAKPTPLGMRGRYLMTRELLRLNMTGKYALGAGVDDLESTEHLADTEQRKSAEGASFFDLIEMGIRGVLEYTESSRGKREALIVTDGKGVILHTNKAWEDLCGFSNEAIQGRSSSFLHGPLTDVTAVAELNDKLTSGVPAHAKIVNYREDGAAFVNSFTVLPIYDWLHGDNVECDLLDATYKVLGPDFFIARLDATPNRPDLEPLTGQQMEQRDAKLNYSHAAGDSRKIDEMEDYESEDGMIHQQGRGEGGLQEREAHSI
jgi:PAS domain S-box-containing protein